MFKDERSGKIALIAHCILNQNSRVLGLAERSSAIAEILELLVQNEIGIIQMPCPELDYAGISRQSQTKNQYNNVMFRTHCRKIAEELANQIQEYKKCEIKLKLIIGVKGSPSCSVNEISGIFMEELHSALHKRAISVPFYEADLERIKENIITLEKFIKPE